MRTRGEPRVRFGACSPAPKAFRLGDRVYLHDPTVCCDCGWRVDRAFAVEEGQLRIVFESGGLSD